MERLNRRTMMIGGLAAAAAAAAAACGMGDGGDDEEPVTIHVHGVVINANPLPTGRIDFVVSGAPATLSGQGHSFLLTSDAATRAASASMWSVQGSLERSVLKLQGLTILANNTTLPGAPVAVELDVKTGDCTWSMGPFLNGTAAITSKGRLQVIMRSAQMSGAVSPDAESSGTPRPGVGGGM